MYCCFVELKNDFLDKQPCQRKSNRKKCGFFLLKKIKKSLTFFCILALLNDIAKACSFDFNYDLVKLFFCFFLKSEPEGIAIKKSIFDIQL
jgi:hypothetical protein